MPVVAMATLFTRSQGYLLPDPEINHDDLQPPSEDNKKIIIVKIAQMILIMLSLFTFYLGTEAMTTQPNDTFICVTFGICLMYPAFFLAGTVNQPKKSLIIFNYIGSFMLLSVGVMSMVSWLSLQLLLQDAEDLTSDVYVKTEYCANLKLASGIVAFFNGVLYFVESVFMTMQNWNNLII